jgi:MFS family permease
MSVGQQADIATSEAGASLRQAAFVLVVCAQAASALVGGAAPMGLPAIRDDLGASSSAIQWYAALFSLGFALVLVLAGRLGDLFGTRRLLLVGYGTFIVAVALSAVAPSTEVLIAVRLLQGVGAGIMAPQLSALIQRLFTGHTRTRAFAVLLMAAGGAFMVGQLVSGALITADLWGLGWRWIYLPYLPFAVVTFAVSARVLPGGGRGGTGSLDLVGAVVLAATAFLVMFPVIQGRSAGWPAWIVAMLVAAVPAFVGFLAYERRTIREGGDPLVNPMLFRIRSFGIGNLITIVVALLSYAAPIYLILTIQSGFDRSALDAAVLTCPMPFANMFGCLLAAPLVRRVGRGAIVVGGVLTGGSAALILLATSAGPGSVEPLHLVPGIALAGFAAGVSMAAATAIVLQETPAEHAGSASGVQATSLQLSGAIGIAAFGTVFYGTIGDSTDLAAYLDAIDNVQWIALGLAALQVAMAWLMPRHLAAPDAEIPPVDGELLMVPDLHDA